MASVKLKLRASTIEGIPGTIYYQVIHRRIVRQKKTGYTLFPYEWNGLNEEVILSGSSDKRREYLVEVIHGIEEGLDKFLQIIDVLEETKKTYTADDIIMTFSKEESTQSLFEFMEKVILQLKVLGRERMVDAYSSTLNSFKRFRNNRNIALSRIDSELMLAYEAYLKNSGISPNSSSFYMRNLRAVYNRAVEKELVIQRHPFKHVYTGIEKTMKRAISLKVIRLMKEMDFQSKPACDFARDMFLFSFYTRGMSFIDMAYLKKTDLSHGILSYRRRKTGQQLIIKWEKCMEELVAKYHTDQSEYLLPIITTCNVNSRKQYLCKAHKVNYHLKYIGTLLNLSMPLTMYVARHAWASIARSKHVPLSVISEGMGHDSEMTTRIYLASLDNAEIDKANSLILRSL